MKIEDIFEQAKLTDMRLAKRIARSGICSRRDAEKHIKNQLITVNDKLITSPATQVSPNDIITFDGENLPEIESVRMWLYHKVSGLVTTNRDELGRKTIFQSLPKDMPRVVSVGRLDLNSEGLLLLTNDGDFSRQLELPNNGWERTYRVRVHGHINVKRLDSLEKGITIEGVRYSSIIATIEGEQTASNVYIKVTLKEGKNREIRRVMEHLGYKVSRLIRVSFGPFNLSTLAKGQVREVTTGQIKQKIMGQKPKKTWAKAKPKKVKPGYKKFAKITAEKGNDKKFDPHNKNNFTSNKRATFGKYDDEKSLSGKGFTKRDNIKKKINKDT